MLRAAFFDLDDTLVDQESASSGAVTTWAAELGVLDDEVSERWSRISARNYDRYQQRELTFTQQRRQRVREFLDTAVADEEADRLFAGYLQHYEARWTAFDDAVPALRRARGAGLTVVVLTNGDQAHQCLKLRKLGLAEEIDVLVASSMLPVGKPDPRAFTHALRLVGVADDEAVMIGNSLEKDVRGAQEAGLHAVLLDRHDVHPCVDVPRVRTLAELDFARGPDEVGQAGSIR